VLASWNGYRIITAPPPSSGGIGLVQLLKMKADLKDKFANVPLNSAQYIHLTAEIEKRVFADRAQYLGDPDFYKVPIAQLIDDDYILKRASEVNPDTPSDTKSVVPGLGTTMPEKAETTHFSVVDKWGNAVSNTYTINGYFGSGVVADGTGVVLNDEMDDFSSKPGVANMFGVVGSDANAIEPRKRPLSSMSPTILTKDDHVAMVIGTPGGSRIFRSSTMSTTSRCPCPMRSRQCAFIISCCRRTRFSGSRTSPLTAISRKSWKRRDTRSRSRVSTAISRSSRSTARRPNPQPIRAAEA
jgi:gamma-glutamyltranspeptidase/glutathione hydrolase